MDVSNVYSHLGGVFETPQAGSSSNEGTPGNRESSIIL